MEWWIVAIMVLTGFATWWEIVNSRDAWIERGWNQGFDECARLKDKRDAVPSEDEKMLLAVLKDAVKKELNAQELNRRGDIKLINSAATIKELETIAWNLFIIRKERGE